MCILLQGNYDVNCGKNRYSSQMYAILDCVVKSETAWGGHVTPGIICGGFTIHKDFCLLEPLATCVVDI